MRGISTALLVMVLSGCTTEGLVNAAYPDRETLRFKSSDGAEVYSYSCVPGDTEAETKQRAVKAHQFFDAEISELAENFANVIIEDVEAGKDTDTTDLVADLDAGAERAALETESKYKCLFLGGKEL